MSNRRNITVIKDAEENRKIEKINTREMLKMDGNDMILAFQCLYMAERKINFYFMKRGRV